MMFGLFGKPRKRQSSDALLAALLTRGQEGAQAAQIGATGALEAAAGTWARAFASASVGGLEGPRRAMVTPEVLSTIGRGLIRTGEVCFVIDAPSNLVPVSSWRVKGGADSSTWVYEVHLAGPDRSVTRFIPAAGVLHFRYGIDPVRPWRGISPLGNAGSLASMQGFLETRLSEEASTKVGHLIALPEGDENEDDDNEDGGNAWDGLRKDLSNMKGGIVLAESLQTNYGQGVRGAPAEWRPQRIGADVPSGMVSLFDSASMKTLAAAGIPPALFSDRDGTSQRESWRRFLHGSIAPVARGVAAEFSVKLEADVELGFDSLFASDLSGRARAFQSMVGGGMAVEAAAALSGLMMQDEGGALEA